MTDVVLTIRHELAFDPETRGLIRDLLQAWLRAPGQVAPLAADPAPAKDDALFRLESALETELRIEAMALRLGPALAAFYRRPDAPAFAATPQPSSREGLPALPVIAGRLGALSDEDRAIILAHREAGAQPNGLARQLGVNPSTIHGILYTARQKRDRAAEGKPHKGRGFWTPEKRAELLRRYEAGESRDALSKAYAATPDAVRLQLYHGRKERAEQQPAAPDQAEARQEAQTAPALASWSPARREELRRRIDVDGETIGDVAKAWGLTYGAVKIQLFRARKTQASDPDSTRPPAAQQPIQAPPPAPSPAPASPTTVRTLDQHRAIAAEISPPPPLPRPPSAPPRQGRQELAAAMAEFEAKKGVIRIPSWQEFAAIGVPMSFTDENHAIEWLTSHGHEVRQGPGRGRITVDGKHMPRHEFRQRAAAIAREYGMKLIAERQSQERAA